jgi:hypothetical protein
MFECVKRRLEWVLKFLFDGGLGMQSMEIYRGATQLIKRLPYKKNLLIEILQNSYKKPFNPEGPNCEFVLHG